MSFFKRKKRKHYKTPKERRQQSLELLAKHNIQSMEGLPLLNHYQVVEIRSKEEVVKRALALVLVAVYAEGLNDPEADAKEHKEFIKFLIERYSAQEFFSPSEQAFLDSESASNQQIIHHSWQYEPFVVMLWALNLLETDEALTIPARLCDVSKAVKIIQEFNNYEEFYECSELRSKEEILDQADLIYRYDWVCVEARINAPENYDVSWGIVMERHKALNWLINYGYDEPQDWDEVSTDT